MFHYKFNSLPNTFEQLYSSTQEHLKDTVQLFLVCDFGMSCVVDILGPDCSLISVRHSLVHCALDPGVIEAVNYDDNYMSTVEVDGRSSSICLA